MDTIIGICSGAALLAESGLLAGCKATMDPSLAAWMRDYYPDVTITSDKELVDAGQVITAAGRNAAFEAALLLIARTYGPAAALTSARAWVRRECDSIPLEPRSLASRTEGLDVA